MLRNVTPACRKLHHYPNPGALVAGHSYSISSVRRAEPDLEKIAKTVVSLILDLVQTGQTLEQRQADVVSHRELAKSLNSRPGGPYLPGHCPGAHAICVELHDSILRSQTDPLATRWHSRGSKTVGRRGQCPWGVGVNRGEDYQAEQQVRGGFRRDPEAASSASRGTCPQTSPHRRIRRRRA